MRPSLSAAHEINALWLTCAGEARIDIAGCPSDEQVAEIIEKYMPQRGTDGTDTEGGQR